MTDHEKLNAVEGHLTVARRSVHRSPESLGLELLAGVVAGLVRKLTAPKTETPAAPKKPAKAKK